MLIKCFINGGCPWKILKPLEKKNICARRSTIPTKPKTSTSEMLEVFQEIVQEKSDKEKILVTTNSMVTHYQIKKNIDLSRPTLRNYGFCSDGFFVTKYPDVFSYRSDGKRKYRGMVIDVDKFKEEIGIDKDGEE